MLKRVAEWYLGIPPAGPGESSQWEWRLSSPWPAGMTAWVASLIAVTMIGAIIFIYWREAPALSRTRRGVLAGLRLAVLALLTVLAAGPTLEVKRTGLPQLVVLLDDSASMRLEDAYQGEELASVRQWLDSGQAASPSRAQLARALLTSAGAHLLKELSDRYTLRVYRFADACEPLGPSSADAEQRPESLADAIGSLSADGTQTRLGEALFHVLNDARGLTPAAVVLLTDGIATPASEVPLHSAAQAAADRGVPLFTVVLGSDRRTRDLELVNLQVDEFAFVGDPLQITGHVRSAGFEGRRIPLTLTTRGLPDDGAQPGQSRTTDVRILSDEGLTRFEWNHIFPSPGRYELLAAVDGQPGEADLTNNDDVRHVTVLDRKIRVLIVESAPRWEFRYLKHALEREPTVEVRTLLLEADLGYAVEDRTALTHFPVIEEELRAYDVIVWGDVDAARFTPQLLTGVRDLVSRTGAGLLVIAGTKDTPQSFADTPLEPLLPVELASFQPEESGAMPAEGFSISLTSHGAEGISIFRVAEEARDSTDFWKRAPQLRWMLTYHRLKPGAVTLLQRTDSEAPVISLQRFGAGQVLFHATDELWLWRYLAGGRHYGRYWLQAIRYLSRARLLSTQQGWEVSSDRRTYAPGDPVHLVASRRTIGGDDPAADRVSVSIEPPSGSQQVVELTRVPGEDQRWQGELRPTEPGRYRAILQDHEFASTNFRVDDTPPEFLERHARRSELVSAAAQTGGRSYTVADADRLAQDLPQGSKYPLDADVRVSVWSRPETLLLFILLLSGEWVLRKRSRLL